MMVSEFINKTIDLMPENNCTFLDLAIHRMLPYIGGHGADGA